MSKGFDYSKWDNIELSDDEDDVHPNIEKESWFRMKHRSRVEREEREEKEKKVIEKDIRAADLRIREIKIIIKTSEKCDDDDDDDDDDLEDIDGLKVEIAELEKANADRQIKLDNFEKNKKWNVDNMSHVVDDKTVISSTTDKTRDFNEESGYALPSKEEEEALRQQARDFIENQKKTEGDNLPKKLGTMNIEPSDAAAAAASKMNAVTGKSSTTSSSSSEKSIVKKPVATAEAKMDSTTVSMLSYAEFTEKYADTILEPYMKLENLDASKNFLLLHGDVLLQENASSYLLLASLEDEMNGYKDKMKLTARQSQILTNIAELAKTLKRHPGNVINPFFKRIEEREYLNNFLDGVNVFIKRVQERSVVKKKEIDAERAQEEREQAIEQGSDLKDIPLEKRLGPGGLDPVEVFDSLPLSMQEAFESREIDKLKEAVLEMTEDDAKYHIDRCVKAGLWNE
eukprot:CAMPEP_0194425070 /NCGR_PEP_ID=MMETSP0176-20130528/24403_1 /TAXON_ID=216777 /ORGANISM="Proboscia alata, Strain PI-D3" /LENGTH=456 /DNA_ID=CAMNT_0039235235 /DNA_START=93 /DNA_END=1463 /DNA_ORIENTATION=-